MDTHQYISECLTFLVFFQIARKCENSSQDLNLNLITPINVKNITKSDVFINFTIKKSQIKKKTILWILTNTYLSV